MRLRNGKKNGDCPSVCTGTTSDHSSSESEMEHMLRDEDENDSCLPQLKEATEKAEEFAKHVWDAGWKCCDFRELPQWLQDNEYLVKGHRPPLPSVRACFKSIFRLHTETGNIWTHLLGCLAFVGISLWFLTRPSMQIQMQDKMVISAFCAGAICCLGLSSLFHTLLCHSESMAKLWSKLDYVGISLLIMGSFFPWLYYGFYCESLLQKVYLTVTFTLGFVSIIVSLWDKFGEPLFRPVRAGFFAAFGLSGVIPAVHYGMVNGWKYTLSKNSVAWLLFTAFLYILGGVIYVCRIPEKWFPGKCDIWFQSHQLFHVLVVVAAFSNYIGISKEMTMHRLYDDHCNRTISI